MNIEERYQSIVTRLNRNERVLDKLSADEINWLTQELTLKQNQNAELKKILCIIENTSTLSATFEPYLINLFKKPNLDKEILIYVLNAARKHSIAYRVKVGERVSADFLLALKDLLHHPDAEVMEWILRVIDECGPQGVFFYKEINNIKPRFFWIFDRHRRNIVQLIDMFHKKWAKNEQR
ncbi:MAG: hypothetical protein JNM93_04945 [Bacteriovoracaceae bacterium]|nr:hypothetical protein [Bacteriovoracaceae bacterium]